MTIDELIQPFKKSNAFEQFIQNNRTKRELNELGKAIPGWKMLCYMLERCNTDFSMISKFDMAYDPQNILALCDKLNIKTDQELYRWIESLSDISVDGIIDAFHPTISLTNYLETDYRTIRNIIKTQCAITDNFIMHNPLDNEYLIINHDDIESLLTKCPTDKMKYIPERRDCDDYSIMMKGWLAECGYGNMAFPIVICNCYQNGNLVFVHAINLIISHKDGSFICEYIEPQTDKRWKVTEQMTMGMQKYDIKIREVWT
ncbi:MAG: hypothetical protein HQK65_04540 [Desulfamplus sp.]|nr:hypothetical protein [Desulfamplus sp.]